MTISRPFFTEEHEAFRETVRRFIEEEILPHHEAWEEAQIVPRELWLKAGEMGLLCPNAPEEYGGMGVDWLFNVVIIEEMARAGASGPGSGFMVHSEMAAPYILAGGSDELKAKWLPRMIEGKAIGALAITEPGAGSDAKAIRTRAVRDGDDYVISGQKTYISNGQNADLFIVACKTDPDAGAKGVSLVLVDGNAPGLERGRNLKKIGLKAQDTSEIFFNDVRVPVANRLGPEGGGFGMMMSKLAQERLSQAVRSICVAEVSLEQTVEYTSERQMFGKTVADFQNTQFVLAQLDAETTALRVFTDWCITRFMDGDLTPVEAAKAKLLVTDLHCKVVDHCLQFFGGYGYMLEYPIARAYTDARITRIAGGASEVMKQIIGRDIFKKQ
ncbi:acyl-CoA dehydrogenase family protein [Aurantiacibacter rhizosphaerae]|uniref:Acyl-[acyl-carrier-protein] dehydrogenase MbtN n=1 Tax=Aurantiacibacter rhizosphaerae TaxID=2691582 RepID=A0A844XGZ1_9SPHN|nr:acyl-CoA dehydrogenase family protein [Aurantiacibacter rhizosphaerae]MWV29286.1 acyl-CoA dehydrogenase [Aurantiacibacter rhizosphaerae]